MKRSIRTLILTLTGAALLAPTALHAATPTPSTRPSPRTTPPAIDPQALALLKRMSATLGGARAFTYRSRSAVEVPYPTGQFITLFSTAEVAVQRPNKISARLAGEAPAFNFYYDGQTVSAFAPATNVYSQSKAPATIDAMLPALENETGIRFATAPLLYSNPYQVLLEDLTSAAVVGSTTTNHVDCVHLACRAPGVNWEIWIASDAQALPLRLAVTFTDRPGFPRTLVEFSNWNINPWFLGAGNFVFHQPANARQIPFLSVLKSADR